MISAAKKKKACAELKHRLKDNIDFVVVIRFRIYSKHQQHFDILLNWK